MPLGPCSNLAENSCADVGLIAGSSSNSLQNLDCYNTVTWS